MNLLEVNVTQNMSFIERVKEITERLMEDLEHNSFSGVEVLRELSKVSEEKEVLMPIVFTGVLKTDGTAGTIEYGFSHTPQVWIDCQIVDELDSEDQEKGLMISWDARKGAIKESIVTEMFEVFIETIRILGTKHSEEWKNPLEIVVPSASQKKVICEQNKNVTKQSLIQQRFVEYAQKNSKRTAVIDALEKVTYGELLERAEYIAGYLRKEFVENSTGLVAIRMKKSANQIAAVMGVLIAGFSYLPIDIKQPLARQEKILSKANIILELDEKKVNMILQNLEYRLEKHPESQNTIAYVIFTSGSILKKFARMTDMNEGVIVDIGAGTGRNIMELAKYTPTKELIALEPSKYMRISFMTRLVDNQEMQKKITLLPLSIEEYNFEEKISGILCMGVLGHLNENQRLYLWNTLEYNLQSNVPVLIEILDKRFLSMNKGKRISVSYQGRLRYESYINDIKKIDSNKWEWMIAYKVFDKDKLINRIESPMYWTYNSIESILEELHDIHFRGVKLSESLLLAKKI